MSYKGLIIKLELEELQLDRMLAKLMAFMQSDYFGTISDTEKGMMQQQQIYMGKYLEILRRRIAYYRMKENM